MSDVSTLIALTVPLVIAAGFDWYVARAYVSAAIQKPHIANLTAGAWVRVGIATGATISAVLGVVSLWFFLTGQRILPQPWGTVFLYATTIVPSLTNVSSLKALRGGFTE